MSVVNFGVVFTIISTREATTDMDRIAQTIPQSLPPPTHPRTHQHEPPIEAGQRGDGAVLYLQRRRRAGAGAVGATVDVWGVFRGGEGISWRRWFGEALVLWRLSIPPKHKIQNTKHKRHIHAHTCRRSCSRWAGGRERARRRCPGHSTPRSRALVGGIGASPCRSRHRRCL